MLSLLGQSGAADRSVTDDEVRLVIAEARIAGVLEKAESKMVASVMHIADRPARGLMVPRHEVDTVQLSDAPDTVIHRLRETGHSRLPDQDGDPEGIVGVFRSRNLLNLAADEAPDELKSRLIVAPVVRERRSALDVVEILHRSAVTIEKLLNDNGLGTRIERWLALEEAYAGRAIDIPPERAAFPEKSNPCFRERHVVTRRANSCQPRPSLPAT